MRARTATKLGPVLAFCIVISFTSSSPALRADDLQPHLFRDFAPGENGQADSDPRNLVQLPEGTWFSARTWELGREAWVIPTGSEVPQLLADLCPGECDGDPYGFAASGEFLLFATGDQFALPGTSPAPRAVWVTAGSLATTQHLFDIPEGNQPTEFWRFPGDPPALPLDDGAVLFLMDKGPDSTELWRSDGTVGGTFSLTSFAVGGFAGISLRGVGSDRLLIVGGLAGGLTEVWRTDGTRGGTRKLESFPLDIRRVSPGVPVYVLGNRPGDPFQYELWSVDSAGRPELLFQNEDDLRLTDQGAVQVGARAVFSVVEEGVSTQLWSTDGTASGTVLRSAGGIPLLDSHLSAAVGDELFYGEYQGDSWVVKKLRMSGTGPPEAVEIACSHECWDSNQPFVRAVGSTVVYLVRNELLGRELAARDALTGERTVFDLCPGTCSSVPGRIRDLEGLFLFSAWSEAHDLQLYSFSPPSRVVRLTDLPLPYGLTSYPEDIPLLQLPDRLYFAASVGMSGVELCSAALDGSHSAVVADLGHEPWSSQASVAAVVADGMFIAATEPASGIAELFWSDGTPEGTRLVPQDEEAGGCYLGYSSPYLDFPRLGERSIYWTRSYIFSDGFDLCLADSESIRPLARGLSGSYLAQGPELFWTATEELWAFDERTAATQPLFTLPVELASAELSLADERWLYFVSTEESLSELWRISRAGEGLSRLAALPPESTSNFRSRAQIGTRNLFFLSTAETVELWATNGTAGGTGSIAAWPSTAGYVDALAFAAYRDRLFFLLASGAAGQTELWSTDGTPAGTEIAARLPAGRSGYSLSARATPLGLYFIAGRAELPAELWRSDGTQAGTFALYPPADGVTGQGAIDFTFFRDRILFSATDDEAGAELWQTFGTRGSTSRAADLRPGALGSGPGGFAVLGDRLFFSADDSLSGVELWAADAPTAFPCPAATDLACTGDGRFRWLAGWRDFADRQGVGQASDAIPGAAAFWFFAPENLELVGKVFDGGPVNGFFWTYLAALSNLETSLTLFDVATGAHADYANPLGRFTSLGDVRSLPSAEAAGLESTTASWLRSLRRFSADAPAAPGTCAPSSTRLCLADGRFAVEVDWRDFAGRAGTGYARELSADTGSFRFFAADNPELVVKILDGAGSNGHFWVFAGALGNLELELTVSDTLTGVRQIYSSPLGRFMSFGDLSSFPQ